MLTTAAHSCPRWLLALALAALAYGPMAVRAHGDAAPPIAARAQATEITGRLQSVTVVDRTTATSARFTMLAVPDAPRYRLDHATTSAAGVTVTVRGHVSGRVVTVDSIRSAAQAAPRAAGARGNLVGVVRYFHMDYPDGTSEFGYVLHGDDGRRNVIDIGAPLPGVPNGARASIAGEVDGDGFITVDTIEILAPATSTTLRRAATATTAAVSTQRYAVAPLKFPTNSASPWTYNADPASFTTMNNNVFGVAPTKSVAEYYKEVSFGQQLLAGFLVNATASAWLQATVARPTKCSASADLNNVLTTIETQAETLAASANPPASGLNWSSYPDGILYVSDSLPCGWSGLGYIGFERAYTNGASTSLLVVGHEMGHNFGLLHAGSVKCPTVIQASSCSVAEYGDPYVIMGNQRAGHFNAYQKNKLGYIAGGVSTHTSSTPPTTYTLGPIESPGQAKYAIKVPTSKSNRTYWVEFRQSIGFDTGFPGISTPGAQLRVSTPFETVSGSDDTQFLDLTPNTNGTFTDSVLQSGQTYTDPDTGVSFQVTNASSAAIDVMVSFGGGGPSSTTTTVASSANPSTQGQSVTFTASVTGNAPTGSVTFKDAGSAIAGCSSIALTGSGNTRTAPCATGALAAGVHSITADYGGDASNAASSSSALSQSVKATSTTTVGSSQNPSTAGASVTFTATVSGSAPTGTVAFTSDGASISGCTSQAVGGSGNSRTATCSTSALASGSHAIVASYGGDGGNGASASAPFSETINSGGPSSTTTALASSANPSTAGAMVTFTATITGNAPTGAVAFTSDGSTIGGCSGVSLSGSGNNRTAACATSGLATGSHAVVATYAGDAGNAGSASAPLSQTVNASPGVPTVTKVASALNPAAPSGAVSFTATVTGGTAANGGAMSFSANGSPIAGCTAVAVSNGNAACNTHLGSGAFNIVATYGGDATHQASTSKVYSQVVSLPGIGNTVAFLASSAAVNENAGSAVVTVLRMGDSTSAASVNYTTTGATASAGSDYTPVSGTLLWSANDTSPRTITIPILDDAASESAETLNVVLSNAIGTTIANVTLPVTIQDDENAQPPLPGVGTVVHNDYGALAIGGGSVNGNTISNLGNNAVIQLGPVSGSPGSMIEIDFQGLDVGPGNTITVRSGAAGQTVLLKNVNGAVSTVSGRWQAQGGNGAPPPHLIVHSASGLTLNAGGAMVAPSGLEVSTLDGDLVNHGLLDGGATLRIDAASVHGTGRFNANWAAVGMTGLLNMPQFGAHYESNALHLYPSSGNAIRLDLGAHGTAFQVVNLMLHGNATVSMPSAWPNGSTMPSNNRPAMPGEVRAAGAADPSFGGGSMIVRATGTLTLDGGVSGDFVFPGGIVLIADGVLDVRGTTLDNGWTTSGTTYQGVFLQAPSIVDSASAAGINVYTNDVNWVNMSVRPSVPVHTFTLKKQGDGTQSFGVADAAAPHLNFYSLVSETGASGMCYVCLVNTQVIDFVAP